MKSLMKHIRLLLLLETLILASGYFIISKSGTGITFGETALLSAIMCLIALVTLVIFFRGQGKDPSSQTMHSLVAVSLKFLMELVLALVWFFVVKKTQLASVVLFFVLYLTFTMFSVLIMMKTLKNRAI